VELPLLQGVDPRLLLVLDLPGDRAQLRVAAVVELRLGEEQRLLEAGDQQGGEIPVRVAGQLRVPEPGRHRLARPLQGCGRALGGLGTGGRRDRADEGGRERGGQDQASHRCSISRLDGPRTEAGSPACEGP